MKNNKKILLIVTGSIAAYKALDLTSKLRQNGYEVRVILSKSATQFVTPNGFEALSGNHVYVNLWESDQQLAHIDLIRWSDLVLVAPATADFLANLVHGKAPDLVGTLSLAHDFKKPFLIAPAMNPVMYQHPAVQDNIQQLKKWGYIILPSPEGVMACNEIGKGRMLETPQIMEAVLFYMNNFYRFMNVENSRINCENQLFDKKIMITCGGTKTYLDDVRFITNFSTGKSGQLLTLNFLRSGVKVHLLKSIQSKDYFFESFQFYSQLGLLIEELFDTPDDLEHKMILSLKQNYFDWIFNLAAIGDFDISEIQPEAISGKISSLENVTVTLKPRIKTLFKIKDYLNSAQICAFKLTALKSLDSLIVKDKVKSLFQNSHVTYVVHNDFYQRVHHQVFYQVFNRQLDVVYQCHSFEELSNFLKEQVNLK